MTDADAELQKLEQEFPQSSRVWATDTDAVLDRRILQIADAAARQLAQKYREEQRNITSVWTDRSFPPPTFADDATMDSAIFSKRAMEASMPYDRLPENRLLAQNPKLENAPPGAELVLSFLQGAGQQAWLDLIAEIVKAGDVELAIYLLSQYRIKFERA